MFNSVTLPVRFRKNQFFHNGRQQCNITSVFCLPTNRKTAKIQTTACSQSHYILPRKYLKGYPWRWKQWLVQLLMQENWIGLFLLVTNMRIKYRKHLTDHSEVKDRPRLLVQGVVGGLLVRAEQGREVPSRAVLLRQEPERELREAETAGGWDRGGAGGSRVGQAALTAPSWASAHGNIARSTQRHLEERTRSWSWKVARAHVFFSIASGLQLPQLFGGSCRLTWAHLIPAYFRAPSRQWVTYKTKYSKQDH